MAFSARRPRLLALAAVSLGAAALLAGACGDAGLGAGGSSLVRREAPPPGLELTPGPRVDHAGVAEPDPRLTPGAVFPSATAAEICRPGYARRKRAVSVVMKRQVFRAYGLRYVRGRFTVDHLVPLELGGANVGRDPRSGRIVVTANLWPQPNGGPATAAIKDRLENYLHDEVCAGRVALGDAQREIAHDWYGAWLARGRP